MTRWVPARTLPIVVVLLGVVLGFFSGGPASITAVDPPPQSDAQILITDAGFEPSVVLIESGQTVVWVNASSTTQTVTHDGGLFDSGTIPPNGAFASALSVSGMYLFTVGSVATTGVIHVGPQSIDAPPDNLVASHIPDLAFPPDLGSDPTTHPELGILVSRTRLLAGFASTTTVAQANTAILASGATIIGGLPNASVLLLAVPPADDFSTVQAAIDALTADPAVAFAMLDTAMHATIVPQVSKFTTWEWDKGRANGNWHFQLTSFPAAWNLVDPIRARGFEPTVVTVVADAGFVADHEDLDIRVPGEAGEPPLCRPSATGQQCIINTPNEHGTHVAGTVGATFGNPETAPGFTAFNRGVDGGNPFAHVVGVPVLNTGLPTNPAWSSTSNWANAWEAILDAAESGQFGDVRVINHSVGQSGPATSVTNPDPDVISALNTQARADWLSDPKRNWNTTPPVHGIMACGSNEQDDAKAGATLPCTWTTYDTAIHGRLANAKLARNLAARASALGIVIVQAAGNESDEYCVVGSGATAKVKSVDFIFTAETTWTIPEENCTAAAGNRFIRQPSQATSQFGVASATWDPADGINPIIGVEALNFTPDEVFQLTTFSNDGGTVSAPGQDIFSTCLQEPPTPPTNDFYCSLNGTSMASPVVAALLGYMLAWDPTLTASELRSFLVNWAQSDAAAPAAPRIDAFRSVISLPGAAKALVDVNDGSVDGNRRLIRGPGDTDEGIDETYPTGLFSDPDGVIDMRDFRRFRDAWLQACLEGKTLTGCPDPTTIVLDGGTAHAKRDLNQDGCIFGTTSCITPETRFARFDFNGDGEISVDPAQVVAMPLLPDGTPTNNPADATNMTDLDVLISQWDGAPDVDWTADDLPSLLVSADLEVHVRGILDGGAEQVTVEMRDPSTAALVTSRTLVAQDLPVEEDFAVMTVPALTPFNVKFTSLINGQERTLTFPNFQMKPGEDGRIDPCGYAWLSTDRRTLRADGASEAKITARVFPCFVELVDIPISFSVTPSGAGHATLSATDVTTGIDGSATVLLKAGTEFRDYTVTATVNIPAPNGDTIARSPSRVISVFNRYEYETIAQTGPIFDGLGVGPSIRDDGAVAFVGSDNSTVAIDDVYAASSPGQLTNVSQGTLSSVSIAARLEGQIQFADNGAIVARAHLAESVGPFNLNSVRDWALGFDSTNPGALELLAKGHSCFECPVDQDADFQEIGTPTVDNAGTPAFPIVGLTDDLGGRLALPTASAGQGYEIGPILGIDSDTLHPVRADTGHTVVQAVFQVGTDDRGLPILDEGIWVGRDVLGTGETALVNQVARVYRNQSNADQWCNSDPPAFECGFGRQPSISDDGMIVAFVGDRGAGPGVFLSYRSENGGYTSSQIVTGESLFGLEDTAGNPIGLTDFPGELRIGVAHADSGPAGLEGDTAVLTFFATPTAAGSDFTDQGGLWALIVDFVPSSVGFDAVPRRPIPVIQIGDVFDGSPIELLGIHDPIANKAGSSEPDDHRLTYWLRAGAQERIIRATWLGANPSTSIQGQSASISSYDTATPSPTAASQPTAAEPELRVAQITAPDTVFPAFVVSNLTPATEEDVTFTNRTRTGAGGPVAATINFGDASTPRLLASGASTNHAYSTGGTKVPSLTATDASGPRSAAITIDVDRTNAPPISDPGGPYVVGMSDGITFDGSASADPDVDDFIAEYSWDLDDDGVFGDRTGVSVSLLAEDVSTLVCSESCVSGTSYPIALRVTDRFDIQATAATTLTPTNPPVADPGGPYNVLEGDDVDLDGRASTDPDAGDTIFEYAWDLNDDGIFGDRATAVATITWLEIERSICGGTCDINVAYPVALQVSDPHGATGITATDLTVLPAVQDFNIAISPDGQPVNPGTTASFLVSVGSFGGFSDDVTLTVSGLPPDWDTSFSPGIVSAGSESTLFVTPPSTQSEGSVALTVVGTSGALVRQSGVSANIAFGLIPVCFGSIGGVVTDIETGQSLAGAFVRVFQGSFTLDTGVTGDDGRYLFEGLTSGSTVRVSASLSPDYQSATSAFLLVVCDATRSDVDIEILRFRFGSIAGNVTDRETGLPVAGAFVGGLTSSVFADAGGAYLASGVPLAFDNQPRTYSSVQAGHADYWSQAKSVEVDQVGPELVDFDLLKKCTWTLGGGTVVDETGAPIVGSSVAFATTQGTLLGAATITDQDGVFRFDREELLAQDNTAIARAFVARHPDDFNTTGFRLFDVEQCGQQIDGLEIIVTNPPAEHFGIVEGFVTTADTGLPANDVGVRLLLNGNFLATFASTDTDANGFYRFDAVRLGEGSQDALSFAVLGGDGVIGYWPGLSDVFVLHSAETVQRDVEMIPNVPASIAGTVRNEETGAPLAGALAGLQGGPSDNTGADGGYRLATVDTGFQNTERDVTVFGSLTGYWPRSVANVTVTSGQTTTVDLALLEVCDGGTIRGIVVNADTLLPLAGATVSVDRGVRGGGVFVETEADGLFELVGAGVGQDNAPRVATVTAQKLGFLTQTQRVTVFCDAVISLDFGRQATAFADITGTVTDAATGDPIGGLFIGSGFGARATTAIDGSYRLIDAPLGVDDADRVWAVTAIHSTGAELTRTVTVTSAGDAIQDFQFAFAGDISVSKSDGRDTAIAGDSLTYLIVASNVGFATVSDVVATDNIPGNVEFTSATPTQGSCGEANGVVTCQLGSLAPGDTEAITIVVQTTTTGEVSNTAMASAADDANPSNNTATDTTTVIDPPDLSIAKTADISESFPGDELRYAITVTNNGPSDAVNVVLVDAPPVGAVFLGQDSFDGTRVPLQPPRRNRSLRPTRHPQRSDHPTGDVLLHRARCRYGHQYRDRHLRQRRPRSRQQHRHGNHRDTPRVSPHRRREPH